MSIKLRYNSIKKAAFIYLSLPLFIFCAGFLRLAFAIPLTAAVAAALFCALRRAKPCAQERELEIRLWEVLVIAAVMLLWGYLGGLNGFYYQNSVDWPYRNAIFHDLIDYDWPVVYTQTGSALDYYIGFWLPPACVAKLVKFIGGSADAAWTAGRLALWLWAAIGTTLTALLLMLYTKANTKAKRAIVLAVFIGFSGLDVLGAWFEGRLGYVLDPANLHMEWWCARSYQFSSLTTCLFWVFNQTVLPWLVVICFLLESDAKNYLFLGAACLVAGPFPFVGLVVCMITQWVVQMVRACRQSKGIKTSCGAISLPNILILCTVLPALCLFYMGNNAVAEKVAAMQTSATQTSAVVSAPAEASAVQTAARKTTLASSEAGETSAAQTAVRKTTPVKTTTAGGTGIVVLARRVLSKLYALKQWTAAYITPELVGFYILEVGIYILLLWSTYYKKPLFHAVAVSLFFIPAVKVGRSVDFCMRASVPGVFILMALCAKYLAAETERVKTEKKRAGLRLAALVLALSIGAFTPVIEVYRGIYNAVKNGTVLLEDDSIGTLANIGETLNFSASEYLEKPFFAYLARATNQASVYAEEGFSEIRQTGTSETEHRVRWGRSQSMRLKIAMDIDGTKEVQFRMLANVTEAEQEPSHLRITVDGEAYDFEITEAAQEITVSLTLSRGVYTVEIVSDREESYYSETDGISYGLTVADMCLTDKDGAVLWSD